MRNVILFSIEEKHQIIQDWLKSGCTKEEIWEKYTGRKQEHGAMLRWMRELGYSNNPIVGKRYLDSNFNEVALKRTKKEPKLKKVEDSFEKLQLKKRIVELEKQLKEAELKAIAFSTMVDIAEKEFKIPIRKKLNTKP